MATVADAGGRQAKLDLALHVALSRSTAITAGAFLGTFPAHIVEKHRDLLLNLHTSLPSAIEKAVLWEAGEIAREIDLPNRLKALDELALAQPPYGDATKGHRVPPPGPSPADAMKAREIDRRREEHLRLRELYTQAVKAQIEAKHELEQKQASKAKVLSELARVNQELEQCVTLGKDWKEADLLPQDM